MKTKFTSHSKDSCSIRYQDKLTDLLEARTFMRDGHHVLEIGFNGYEMQLCKGLFLSGIPIILDESVNLINVIRKEYKIFRYQQTKFLRG